MTSQVTIPPWVPGIPPAGTLNTQNDISTAQENVAKRSAPIPLCYGPFQTAWMPCVADYASGTNTWTVLGIVCMGEIEAIDNIYIDGAAPLPSVVINAYTGTTTQTVDSMMSTARAGFTDTLVYTDADSNQVGIAYVVVQYTDDDYKGLPDVVVEGRGRKVWNGTQTIYSELPAYFLADILRDPIVGKGDLVDGTSLGALAVSNNDFVGADRRRFVGLVLDVRQTTDQWVEILRGYASAWANKRGDTWYFAADRPRSTDVALSDTDIFEVPKIGRVDEVRIPTQVRVIFTDNTTLIWRTRTYTYPESLPAGTPRRLSEVRMPGVYRYAHAVREAEERYNKLQSASETISLKGFDEQIAREAGDVIDVTHAIGLTNALYRVTEKPKQVSPGLWEIQAAKYDDTVYSDADPADPGGGAAERYFGGGSLAGTINAPPIAIGPPATGDQYGGGEMTVRLYGNQVASGAQNDGEIRVTAGYYRLPDGTVRSITSDKQLNTPYEGATVPPNNIWYVAWGATDATTRFPTLTLPGDAANEGLFNFIHDADTDTYTAIGNDVTGETITGGLLATDYIVAVGTKISTSGGMDSLAQVTTVLNSAAFSVGGIIYNAWMSIRDEMWSRPAGWFVSSSTDEKDIGYADAAGTVLRVDDLGDADTAIAAYSTAWQVQSDVVYSTLR